MEGKNYCSACKPHSNWILDATIFKALQSSNWSYLEDTYVNPVVVEYLIQLILEALQSNNRRHLEDMYANLVVIDCLVELIEYLVY